MISSFICRISLSVSMGSRCSTFLSCALLGHSTGPDRPKRQREVGETLTMLSIVDAAEVSQSLSEATSKGVLSVYATADQCSDSHVPDRLTIFAQLVATCQRLSYSSAGSEDCESITVIHLDDGTVITKGREIGNGGYAYVYATDRADVVLKISMSRSLCPEKAILSILSDSDIAPIIFSFSRDTSISPFCHARIVLMEKVGDIDWERSYSPFYAPQPPPIAVSYCHIARLLQIVKRLHSTGFTHRDIHDENVRLSRTDPRKIWLIDFGKVRPLSEQDRLDDLQAVAKLAPLGDPNFIYFKQTLNDPEYLFSACEYDRWINQFLSLANKNLFTDCI